MSDELGGLKVVVNKGIKDTRKKKGAAPFFERLERESWPRNECVRNGKKEKRTGIFSSDRHPSREATTGNSHGCESVGPATPQSSVSRNATACVPWPDPNDETMGWAGIVVWRRFGRNATGGVF